MAPRGEGPQLISCALERDQRMTLMTTDDPDRGELVALIEAELRDVERQRTRNNAGHWSIVLALAGTTWVLMDVVTPDLTLALVAALVLVISMGLDSVRHWFGGLNAR